MLGKLKDSILLKIFEKVTKLNEELDVESDNILLMKNIILVFRKRLLEKVFLVENYVNNFYKLINYGTYIVKLEESKSLKGLKRNSVVNEVRRELNYGLDNVDDMIDIMRDNVIFGLDQLVRKLRENKKTMSDARDEYKLTADDLKNIPYEEYLHSVYRNVCKLYCVEDIKKYVKQKYGQKKLEERRDKSDKRKEKMKDAREIEREKRIEMNKMRKQRVLDLLSDNGLYFDDDNRYASEYIDGEIEFEEGKILEMAEQIHNSKRMVEERRERLREELEKYGCELRGDSILCERYIKSDNGDLETIVNVMREMKFLFEKTEYSKLIKSRQLEYYDGILREQVVIKKYRKLFEKDDDIYKTYAVEKFMDTVYFAKENNFCPNILWRIEEVNRSREENKIHEEEIRRRREERKKNNIEKYEAKKKKKL